jgi:hypothetical protein
VHDVLLGREHLVADAGRAELPAFEDLVEPKAGGAPLVLDLNDPQLLVEAANVRGGCGGGPYLLECSIRCLHLLSYGRVGAQPADAAAAAAAARLPQLRALGHSAAVVVHRPARVKVVLGEALGRDDAALELSR